MRFLFRKRHADRSQKPPNRVSAILYSFYTRVQKFWVKWMERFAAKLSRTGLKYSFAVFVLAGSSYCIYMIAGSFTGKRPNTFSVTHTSKPDHITDNGEKRTIAPVISEKEYSRIKGFRAYMDSLAATSSGRRRYDSIVGIHPGLMDSLKFIEKYYEGKFKNEKKWKNK